jgi:hypothetical protein
MTEKNQTNANQTSIENVTTLLKNKTIQADIPARRYRSI